jgi:choline dehydrogenase-like flavoprotein
MHFPVEAWVDHVVAHGVAMPPHFMTIAPNVSKPHSRGRVWITSADPEDRPSLDYRYFTDPDGADEAVLVAAVRAARRIGESEPMASKLRREVFPGPPVTSDADISALAGRPTRPSTTSAAPAGWAPPTTRSPCSTRNCESAAYPACG